MSRRPRFVECYRGGLAGRGAWRWRQVGANGEITAASEAYSSRSACHTGALDSNPGLDIRWVHGAATPRKLSGKMMDELRAAIAKGVD